MVKPWLPAVVDWQVDSWLMCFYSSVCLYKSQRKSRCAAVTQGNHHFTIVFLRNFSTSRNDCKCFFKSSFLFIRIQGWCLIPKLKSQTWVSNQRWKDIRHWISFVFNQKVHKKHLRLQTLSLISSSNNLLLCISFNFAFASFQSFSLPWFSLQTSFLNIQPIHLAPSYIYFAGAANPELKLLLGFFFYRCLQRHWAVKGQKPSSEFIQSHPSYKQTAGQSASRVGGAFTVTMHISSWPFFHIQGFRSFSEWRCHLRRRVGTIGPVSSASREAPEERSCWWERRPAYAYY